MSWHEFSIKLFKNTMTTPSLSVIFVLLPSGIQKFASGFVSTELVSGISLLGSKPLTCVCFEHTMKNIQLFSTPGARPIALLLLLVL